MSLLEGLEISIVKLSGLDQVFRIDAEYYRPEVLNLINLFNTRSSDTLGNLADFVIGPFGSTVTAEQYVDDSEYCYIRNKDINDFRVKSTDLALIPKNIYEGLPRYHVKKNDLFITVVGTLGKVAIATDKDTKSIFSCKSTLIRTKNINPFYLLTYLNTKIGSLFSLRGRRGAIQEGLNLPDLKEIQVYIPSNIFQKSIEEIIRKSFKQTKKAEISYKQAENLLLTELDLLNFEATKEAVSIKSFSSSFKQTGRLDAEYYQPKYENIIDKVKSNRYEKLGLLVSIKKSIEPGSAAYQETGIPFLRVSNISKHELTTPNIHLSKTLLDTEKLEKLYPKKNTILLSKDGSVGIAYNVKSDMNVITSGALLHLIIKNEMVLPEYLTLVLNSVVVKMQSERDAGGSIIQHWKPSEIEEVVIPILDMSIQKSIENKINDSFKLKEESQHLLEVAKRGVEIAIEENEESALAYINEQTIQIIH